MSIYIIKHYIKGAGEKQTNRNWFELLILVSKYLYNDIPTIFFHVVKRGEKIKLVKSNDHRKLRFTGKNQESKKSNWKKNGFFIFLFFSCTLCIIQIRIKLQMNE